MLLLFLDGEILGVGTDILGAVGGSTACLALVIVILAYKLRKDKNRTIYAKSLQPNENFEVYNIHRLQF